MFWEHFTRKRCKCFGVADGVTTAGFQVGMRVVATMEDFEDQFLVTKEPISDGVAVPARSGDTLNAFRLALEEKFYDEFVMG